jgi:hypothetical protein
VPITGLSTSTNPNTGGTVNTGWLEPVYGKDLYVRVTLVHNGNVSVETQSIPIDLAPVVVYDDDPNTTGNVVSSHLTIQAAIDAASTGNFITVDAGTYEESLSFTKSLTVLGPNEAISPNTGVRVGEAIIQPLNGTAVTGNAASITVVMKGFTFDQTNSTGSNSHFVYQTGKANTTWTFENSIFQNSDGSSTSGNRYITGSTGVDLTLTDN